MGRTNAFIDDELVARVMRLYRLLSKRAAVDFALCMAAGEASPQKAALQLRGSGWDADLEELRRHEGVVEP
jgi:Arc/MetJ family transcription regulator